MIRLDGPKKSMMSEQIAGELLKSAARIKSKEGGIGKLESVPYEGFRLVINKSYANENEVPLMIEKKPIPQRPGHHGLYMHIIPISPERRRQHHVVTRAIKGEEVNLLYTKAENAPFSPYTQDASIFGEDLFYFVTEGKIF